MASTEKGHVAIEGVEYAIAENTYIKQLQTPFNNRFSTGDPSVGDLTFFQYLAMDDFSGGNGQEIFDITNRFLDSDGIDVTTPGELKLAPQIDRIRNINGPQRYQLNSPLEDSDQWPQVIEWLGKAVIFNDRIEYDAGGVDFLEVFETDVLRDTVINTDTSGTSGVITNESRAEILDISKVSGLPGDTFKVTAKFTDITMGRIAAGNLGGLSAPKASDSNFKISFKLYFGGNAAGDSIFYSEVNPDAYAKSLFTQTNYAAGNARFYFPDFKLNSPVTIEFIVRIPNVNPGVYNLWTEVSWGGRPFSADSSESGPRSGLAKTLLDTAEAGRYFYDDSANAKVLFFVESTSNVIVNRKNLYAPQLKAACVSGVKLIGGRVFNNKTYIEVYEEQNGAVDRTLQIDLTATAAIPNPPSAIALIASNDVIVAAFDNLIYKIDITTAGLTDAQRLTSIGTIPGTYVTGMEIWNQRVYIGSFDRSRFTSAISWSNMQVIERSYAIDGKFWITDMAAFNGALFYSGGTQDGIGQVRAFPSEIILEFDHPEFDNRVRTLNAGRHLYAGWSHGTGIGVITSRGASSWAKIDLEDNVSNVVWDIEEVGDTVFMLASNGFFKTTDRYLSDPRFGVSGSLETSKIGANTPLIDKNWATVTIALREKAPPGTRVKVWASNATAPDTFSLVGTIGFSQDSNDVNNEFNFPQNFTSPWIKLLIELSTTDPLATAVVKNVTIKYVPKALTKKQWTFGVRAYDNLVLLNDEKSDRDGKGIQSGLFDLPAKGNVTFRDIDNTEYSVIVSDMKQTNPIINKQSLEGLVMVELLEI